MGGLRVETLRQGEFHAKGFFHWLHSGTTDSQLGDGVKQPYPNLRFLQGLDSPMGTTYGLSKYPYIRESRRIIGRPGWGHSQGFTVSELDISRRNYSDKYYQTVLNPGTELEFVIMVIAVSCVKLLSAHNSTQHTSRKHKV
jgi:hypothetical protein